MTPALEEEPVPEGESVSGGDLLGASADAVPRLVTFENLPYGNDATNTVMQGQELELDFEGNTYLYDMRYISFETPVMYYGGNNHAAWEFEIPADRYEKDAAYPLEIGKLTLTVPVKAKMMRFRGNRVSGEYVLEEIKDLAGPYQETVYADRDAAGNLLLTDRLYLITYTEGGRDYYQAASVYASYEETLAFPVDPVQALQAESTPVPTFTPAPELTEAPPATPVPETVIEGNQVTFGYIPYGQEAMRIHMDSRIPEIRFMDQTWFFTSDFRHCEWKLREGLQDFGKDPVLWGGNTDTIYEYGAPPPLLSTLKAGGTFTYGEFSINLPVRQGILYRMNGDRSTGVYTMDDPIKLNGTYTETVEVLIEEDGKMPKIDRIWLFTWQDSEGAHCEAASFYAVEER